jgi:fatty-acid desaturase
MSSDLIDTPDLATGSSSSGIQVPVLPHSRKPKGRTNRVRKTFDASVDKDDEGGRLEDWEKEAIANRWKLSKDIPTLVWIVLVHAGAIAAPFYFTWEGLGLAAGLAWLTGSVGVCMGYHRQLTHQSFQTYRPIRWLLAWLGGQSGEGGVMMWVANHRKHHAYSDKHGDPHSPRDGAWWSHMLWFMPNFGSKYTTKMADRYCPDIKKDRGMRIIHAMFLPSHVIVGLSLLGGGYWYGISSGDPWYYAISFLVWGMSVRLMYVLHVTWFVNSASHMWGYRNYETTDDSRNLWWVGILAFGEGWHNNHHAYQRMARQGHKWWEIDTTYWLILAMEKCGLAWNVVKKVPKNQKPA